MVKHNLKSFVMDPTILPTLPRLRPDWRDILILLIGYIALDWASYIHPLHRLNITPWNPAPALGLIFLLRFGRHAVLPLSLSILTADYWVRHLPASLALSIGLALLLTLGYWAIAETLRRRLTSGGIFADKQGLIEWAGIITMGTLLNSLFFVSALAWGGLLPVEEIKEALFRYWVGDSVGVLVTMPILWMLFDERGRAQLKTLFKNWDALKYLIAMSVVLWVAFGLGAKADFKYFYVLFLPVAWAAARQGLSGAVLCAIIVQIGIIGAVEFLDVAAVTIVEIQILGAGLVLFGFFIGIVVDEKQRVSADLRQTLRLAAAGEMAGALAHELNQPLSALTAYGAACEQMLAQGETGERLRESIRLMIAQSYRAADVVRRLRDFFKTGATKLDPVDLGQLLTSAAAPFTDKAETLGVDLKVMPGPACTLLADHLQLEVVMRNLISNAFDAVSDKPPGQRQIRVSATPAAAGRVCVQVEDSGPGFTRTTAPRLFEAFQSTKASGLGLGLVISRAIAEAHGGNLWAEMADHGIFKLELPTEGKREDAT